MALWVGGGGGLYRREKGNSFCGKQKSKAKVHKEMRIVINLEQENWQKHLKNLGSEVSTG